MALFANPDDYTPENRSKLLNMPSSGVEKVTLYKPPDDGIHLTHVDGTGEKYASKEPIADPNVLPTDAYDLKIRRGIEQQQYNIDCAKIPAQCEAGKLVSGISKLIGKL
tara:strand:- start:43 stop:369 length:327 start_codon:yes stop_codon:yes gene_type:complete